MNRTRLSVFALALFAVGCGGADAVFARGDRPSSLDRDGGDLMGTELPALFDGHGTDAWLMAGHGDFVALDGMLHAVPGDNLGLYWCTTPTPPDFVLTLEYRRSREHDNSGVFVRFPDPRGKGYDNTAYVGVDFGFEVQIDDSGSPDGAPMHRTGAIYNQPTQAFSLQPSRPIPEWNAYEIRVQGQRYTVSLNGVQSTQFDFAGDPQRADRGLPSSAAAPRYIGLQSHTGLVSFRNIRLGAL